MNERIKVLLEQTGGFVDINQFLGGEKGCVIYTYEGLEKFAELIVRECAEQSMSIGRYHDINGITPDLAIAIAVGLKKHFGVEECPTK